MKVKIRPDIYLTQGKNYLYSFILPHFGVLDKITYFGPGEYLKATLTSNENRLENITNKTSMLNILDLKILPIEMNLCNYSKLRIEIVIDTIIDVNTNAKNFALQNDIYLLVEYSNIISDNCVKKEVPKENLSPGQFLVYNDGLIGLKKCF